MKHIVALSGGKDSTAMALRLAETEPREYIYACTPTGNEPPELFMHWMRLEVLLGKSITYISDPRGLEGPYVHRMHCQIGVSVGAPVSSKWNLIMTGSKPKLRVFRMLGFGPMSRPGTAWTLIFLVYGLFALCVIPGDGSLLTFWNISGVLVFVFLIGQIVSCVSISD